MKLFKIYIIVWVGLCALAQSCGVKSGLPDLRETYQYKDTKPFGGYVAHALLTEIYPDKLININKKSFSKFREETYADSSSFYLSISKNFFSTKADVKAILDFVEEGHTFFISAAYIDTVLLDKVYCRQSNNNPLSMFFGLPYSEGHLTVQDSFNYFYHPFYNYFSEVDSLTGRVIGRSQGGQPNLIVLFIGKGRLYLHCDPRAFSNYFLLNKDNYAYMTQALQYSKEKPGNIFWDDFYNKKNYPEDGDRRSALSILFQYPELTIAFWILLAMLLLYILFNGKRKQRIIPVIKPVENTSIAFTQAIAALYMAEKDNKSIAEKMITYFNEHIRHRYFLNMHGSAKLFTQSLSKKSGVSFESVQALYNTIEQVQLAEQVSDFELLSLNEQIQQFYKNRN